MGVEGNDAHLRHSAKRAKECLARARGSHRLRRPPHVELSLVLRRLLLRPPMLLLLTETLLLLLLPLPLLPLPLLLLPGSLLLMLLLLLSNLLCTLY